MNKVYLPFAVLLLVLCQACDSADATKLRTENHELKIRLAALGQDTTSASAAYASVPGTPADTSKSTTPSSAPSLSLSGVAGAPAPATSTGTMWKVKHYVNDFGEKTKEGFLSNESMILGSFSNSATQDSPLLVKLLFDKDLSMNIQLYEYARNNPVKAYGSEEYIVKVKDKDGKSYRLHGTNYTSDRLTLDKSSSKQLHTALLKGGKLMFVINEEETPTTEYHFALDNADGYLAARKELKGVK